MKRCGSTLECDHSHEAACIPEMLDEWPEDVELEHAVFLVDL